MPLTIYQGRFLHSGQLIDQERSVEVDPHGPRVRSRKLNRVTRRKRRSVYKSFPDVLANRRRGVSKNAADTHQVID